MTVFRAFLRKVAMPHVDRRELLMYYQYCARTAVRSSISYDQVISLIVFDKKHSTDLLRNNLPKNAFETKIPF